MSVTVTNYLSRVNRDFPVRGQDNDSQGFRDNWKNLHDAIQEVNTDLETLDLYTIKTNNTATFYGNTIEDVNFKNTSVELYNLDLQDSNIEVDYVLGSYQKFEVTAGLHSLTVINWPGPGKSGLLRLSITAVSDSYTAINFPDSYINLNPQPNPFELTNTKPNVFELFSEEGSDTVFVRYLTAFTYNSSSTASVLWADQLKLGKINNNTESTVFSTSTKKSTVVKRGNEFAEIGLVPNRIDKVLRYGTESIGPGSIIQLQFDTVTDLVPGAFFYSTLTNTMYTVTTVVSTNTVAIAPNDIDISDLTANVDSFKFTNPTFIDQPTLLTLAPNPANTSTGSKSNFIGSVYANQHRLEVTYKNFGSENTNTFAVQKLATNTDVSYVNTDLVDTTFIHSLLPIGAVIMWYGRKTEVPYGWAVCDGSEVYTILNGVTTTTKIKTPNLTNRFAVGADNDVYSVGNFSGPGSTVTTSTTSTQGGTADLEVIYHNHTGTFTGTVMPTHTHTYTDPTHSHASGSYNHVLLPPASGSLTGSDTVNSGIEANVETSQAMASAGVGITIDAVSAGTPAGSVNVATTGTTDGIGMNVPPFTALYYIMKIAGTTATNTGIVVGVSAPPPPAPPASIPTADFSATPLTGTAPLTVTFSDSSTDTPTSWAWDFDNSGSTDSTSQNPSYTYSSAGTYSVKLTATNSAGSDTETKTSYITVSAAPPAAPVANFSGTPLTGTVPLTVAFTDSSTNTPTSWAWDFDNSGSTDSTSQNPSYTYSSAGTYSVKLTATNAGGSDTETKTSYVTVSAPSPTVSISLPAVVGPATCYSTPFSPFVYWNNAPSGATGSFNWTFTNGVNNYSGSGVAISQASNIVSINIPLPASGTGYTLSVTLTPDSGYGSVLSASSGGIEIC